MKGQEVHYRESAAIISAIIILVTVSQRKVQLGVRPRYIFFRLQHIRYCSLMLQVLLLLLIVMMMILLLRVLDILYPGLLVAGMSPKPLRGQGLKIKVCRILGNVYMCGCLLLPRMQRNTWRTLVPGKYAHDCEWKNVSSLDIGFSSRTCVSQ